MCYLRSVNTIVAKEGHLVSALRIERFHARNFQPPPSWPPLVPIKTTWTEANLCARSVQLSNHRFTLRLRRPQIFSTEERAKGTHAAVAAKISTLLAFVVTARANEKTAVKAAIIPSLYDMHVTVYRTAMELTGKTEEITVP